MIVNYINAEQRADCVRCTFIGRDADDRTRRPVIDLDSSDLAQLIAIAKAFEVHQQKLARAHIDRAASVRLAIDEA